MREFKYSFIGLASALVFFVASLIVELDVFEALVAWMHRFEDYELDEILLAIIPLSLGVLVDLVRHYFERQKNRSRLETLRATMRTVDDIVGNAHQSLTYFVYLAEEQKALSQENSHKFHQILEDTQLRLKELRQLEKVVEKELTPGISVIETNRPKNA